MCSNPTSTPPPTTVEALKIFKSLCEDRDSKAILLRARDEEYEALKGLYRTQTVDREAEATTLRTRIRVLEAKIVDFERVIGEKDRRIGELEKSVVLSQSDAKAFSALYTIRSPLRDRQTNAVNDRSPRPVDLSSKKSAEAQQLSAIESDSDTEEEPLLENSQDIVGYGEQIQFEGSPIPIEILRNGSTRRRQIERPIEGPKASTSRQKSRTDESPRKRPKSFTARIAELEFGTSRRSLRRPMMQSKQPVPEVSQQQLKKGQKDNSPTPDFVKEVNKEAEKASKKSKTPQNSNSASTGTEKIPYLLIRSHRRHQ